jgi:hypothetical protein
MSESNQGGGVLASLPEEDIKDTHNDIPKEQSGKELLHNTFKLDHKGTYNIPPHQMGGDNPYKKI